VAPVDPVANEWERLLQDAVTAFRDAGRAPLDDSMTEERYRAHRVRMLAADRILGFRKGGPPRPTPRALKLGQLDLKDGDRVIRRQWADGRLVKMPPFHRSGQVDGDDDA